MSNAACIRPRQIEVLESFIRRFAREPDLPAQVLSDCCRGLSCDAVTRLQWSVDVKLRELTTPLKERMFERENQRSDLVPELLRALCRWLELKLEQEGEPPVSVSSSFDQDREVATLTLNVDFGA